MPMTMHGYLLLFLAAFSAPCSAVVEQFVRFNATMDLSPVAPGGAATFINDPVAVASFETLTKTVFEDLVQSRPDLNPLFVSMPEILTIKAHKASERSGGLAVNFETSVKVFSESGLTDQNFLVDIKFAPYWYAGTLRILDYMSDLADQSPAVFGSVSGFQIDYGTPRTYSPGTTAMPVATPTVPPVTTPTIAPMIPPTMAPVAFVSTPAPVVVVAPTLLPVAAPTLPPVVPTPAPAPTLPPVVPTPAPAPVTLPPFTFPPIVPSPTYNPAVLPTPTVSTPAPIIQVTVQPVAFQGVEQLIAVNATLVVTGVVSNSAEIFSSDPTTVSDFEKFTQQSFEEGIANPPANTNTIFTLPPEILSLMVVDVDTTTDGNLAVTFETTMRAFADTVLTEENFLADVKFGRYWSGDAGRSFDYLVDLQSIFPTMFDQDGSFQIFFDIAKSMEKPSVPGTTVAPTASPTDSSVTEMPTLGDDESTMLPTGSPTATSERNFNALNSNLSSGAFNMQKTTQIFVLAVNCGLALVTAVAATL